MYSIHSVPATIYGLLSVASYHWPLLINKYRVLVSNNPDQRNFCTYEEILPTTCQLLLPAHLCGEKQAIRAKIRNHKGKSSSLVRVILNLAFQTKRKIKSLCFKGVFNLEKATYTISSTQLSRDNQLWLTNSSTHEALLCCCAESPLLK